eukprot:COSAG01_NODE_35460_length_531_cov_1.224537_2_plen_78_part_01
MLLLSVLAALVCGFLVLVVVDKPYADGKEHEGFTKGDKAQVVTQVAMLIELALAALWLHQPEESALKEMTGVASALVI